MTGTGRAVINLVLLLACLAGAVLAAEVVLRMLDIYSPPHLVPKRTDLYTQDDTVGYRLLPSLRTSYHYPPGNPVAIPINSNAHGYRGSRELLEPDERPRILVLGDSFVFGSGVREEERITEVLESLQPSWRVDNMGITGWGIDLMIRALEHTGVELRPAVVVLAVYTDDFRRVHPYYAGMGFKVPKFVLRNGQLLSSPFPEPQGWQRLHIYQAIYQLLGNRRSVRDRFDINTALLNRFLRNSRQFGFVPALVFFPGKSDTRTDQKRRKFLADWAAAEDVAFLDLTREIHAAGVENTYIPGNWHWNATGHRIAAERLHAFLKAHVIK